MTEVETLEELRKEIDAIDKEIVTLFEARMKVAGKIAEAKQGINKPIFDQAREELVLVKNADRLNNQAWREELKSVYREMMKQSRAIQKKRMGQA